MVLFKKKFTRFVFYNSKMIVPFDGWNFNEVRFKDCRPVVDCSKRQLSKSFTVVIHPLSTRLMNQNFCFDLSYRRSTIVSLETRNSVVDRHNYPAIVSANKLGHVNSSRAGCL